MLSRTKEARGIPVDDRRSKDAQPSQRLRECEAVYRNRLNWAKCVGLERTLKQSRQLEQRHKVKEPHAWETDNRDPQAILDQYKIPGLPELPTASSKQTDTWAGSHPKYVTLAAGSVTWREVLEARIGGTVQSYRWYLGPGKMGST